MSGAGSRLTAVDGPPIPPPRRLSSHASVARIRAPVAPTGWPSEMPEPLGLSRSSAGSTFHSRSTASIWAAKASFSSMTSRSASASPQASACAPRRARDRSPRSRARPRRPPRIAAPASAPVPDAWPRRGSSRCRRRPRRSGRTRCRPSPFSGSASTMIGRSLARASRDASGRMCSSAVTTVCPPRPVTVTPTSSPPKRPDACAAAALRCEASASSSCSARLMPYCRRRFSAVSIIPPRIGWSRPPAMTSRDTPVATCIAP